jgi:hypothetical protein
VKNLNYKETLLTEDIGKILGDRQTAEYLDGVFSVIRSIVGYSTVVCDVLYKEILKDKPDKQTIIEVLNESHAKMAQLLGDITDAHQLVYETHITDLAEKKAISLTESVEDTAERIREMLHCFAEVTFFAEPDLYAAVDKTDIEIILTDMVYRVISYDITPSNVKISLERSENGKRAVLIVQGVVGGGSDKEMPLQSETAGLVRSDEVAKIFARNFCESVNGLSIETESDEGLTISLEIDTVTDPVFSMSSDLRDKIGIDFTNKRFSPAAVKFARFRENDTYTLTGTDE